LRRAERRLKLRFGDDALRHFNHSFSFWQEYDPPFKNGVSLELTPNMY
jgi:hypothetical protein